MYVHAVHTYVHTLYLCPIGFRILGLYGNTYIFDLMIADRSTIDNILAKSGSCSRQRMGKSCGRTKVES